MGQAFLLGSATPSLESFYRAKQGKYRLFTLNERLTGGVLPTVYVEDLRQELKNGNRSFFPKGCSRFWRTGWEGESRACSF